MKYSVYSFSIGKYIVQMESYTLIQACHMNKAEPKQTLISRIVYITPRWYFPEKSQIIHPTCKKNFESVSCPSFEKKN